MSTIEFEHSDGLAEWRVLDGRVTAWFDAPSHAAGAALVGRIAEVLGGGRMPDVDLRQRGLRVGIGAPGATEPTGADVALARTVSRAAGELGLAADPGALQSVRLTVRAADRSAVAPFWQTALGYQPAGARDLRDPLRRDPPVRMRSQQHPHPLRNRLHLDVVRPAEAVTAARAAIGRAPYGAYGVTLADAEGNEIDLLPGDPLGPSPSTADWRVLFSAMACYPTTSTARSAELAAAVASAADDAGVPLMVDLRPEGVTIDSGKDQWEDDRYAGAGRFADLAAGIQSLARGAGFEADAAPLRFVQVAIDAVDVPAVRHFWAEALGHTLDPREAVTDIVDPRRLAPVLIFQEMDPPEPDRLSQLDRIRLDLVIPRDAVRGRIDRAVRAGGRVLSESTSACRLADPEGNVVRLVPA
jgi:hypothetical protein